MIFSNLIKPNKQKPTVINQDKELANQKRETQKFISENGQNFAKNFGWEKDQKLELNFLPPVVYLRETYQSLVNNVGAIYDKNLNIFKTTYNKYEKEFGGNTVNDSDVSSEIKDLESEREIVLNEATACHDDDIKDKQERATTLKTEIKHNRTDLNSLKRHNLKSRKIGAGIIILLLVLGEVFLNKEVFSYAGFVDSACTFIGIAMAVGTFILGVGKATIWRSQKFSMPTKIMAGVGLFLLVATVYYFLGTIRISQMASQGENDGIFGLSPIYFAGFNLILYFGIFICKLVIYPSPQMISDNEKYDIANQKLQNNRKEYKRIQKEIANGYQTRNKTRNAVQQQYGKKINPIKESIKAENIAIRKSALDFNRELALARNFYKQTNADYKAGVASLVNTINLYRKADIQPIPMTAIDNLENPFEGIQLLVVKTKTVAKTISQKTTHEEKTAWEVLADNQSDEANYSFINSKEN